METRVLNDFNEAAKALELGQLVAIPTETVYGLAGNALSESVLAEIFSTKERPTFDPLIVHVSSKIKTLEDLTKAGLIDLKLLSAAAQTVSGLLIKRFWPGPLTLVLPKGPSVPDLATSGLATVALRQPSHLMTQNLLNALPFPLAAPSANRFGRISPTSSADVLKELGGRIPFVLDGGPCERGIESTVVYVDAHSGNCSVLRPGALSLEELRSVLGINLNATLESRALAAPGMLKSHYSPRKPLYLLKQGSEISALPPRFGILRFTDLSPTCDDREAARNLFSKLRALDESDAEILLADTTFSKEGLRYAIHDRLQRASSGEITPRLLGSL